MLLVSQKFVKSLSEAHSSCSDFTTSTKTGLCFLLPPAPKQVSALTRQACSSRGYCLKYNYLKTSAWCYKSFCFAVYNFNTGKEHFVLLVLSATIKFRRKWLHVISHAFCIIPHNKPNRKRID